jgi:hypothetical protein
VAQGFGELANQILAETIQNPTQRFQQSIAPYGLRYSDVTTGQPPVEAKGLGYFGGLPTDSGQTMTEFSTSFEINGQPISAPLVVPTLTPDELEILMSGQQPTESIYTKAYLHAMDRVEKGVSPFATGSDLRIPSGQDVYGVPIRKELFPTEDEYFKANPNVAGMAADDNQIILNPYSELSDSEKQSVALNEAARVRMRQGMVQAPTFDLTEEQQAKFMDYSPNVADIRATIASRILSGDPSAGIPTADQMQYVDELRQNLPRKMGIDSPLSRTPKNKTNGVTSLEPEEEGQFQNWIRNTGWFKEFVDQYGEEPDLNITDYDYRAAWKAGIEPVRDPYDQNRYHWASSTGEGQMLKSATHPTAWKETFMRQTGQNPDALGISSKEQADVYIQQMR